MFVGCPHAKLRKAVFSTVWRPRIAPFNPNLNYHNIGLTPLKGSTLYNDDFPFFFLRSELLILELQLMEYQVEDFIFGCPISEHRKPKRPKIEQKRGLSITIVHNRNTGCCG